MKSVHSREHTLPSNGATTEQSRVGGWQRPPSLAGTKKILTVCRLHVGTRRYCAFVSSPASNVDVDSAAREISLIVDACRASSLNKPTRFAPSFYS